MAVRVYQSSSGDTGNKTDGRRKGNIHPSRFHFFNCCAVGRVDSSEERNNGLFHMAAPCEEPVKLASREKTAAKDGTRPNACLLTGSERRAVGGRE